MNTRQETFNQVVRGLASQRWERSVDPSTGLCAYRGAGGTKCAAGHLIPDEDYDKSFEGWGVTHAYVSPCFRQKHYVYFVRELQMIHDNGKGGEVLRNCFHQYAYSHGLQWPEDVA